MLAFSALSGVRLMIEHYLLERTAQAYDRMISGRTRFRVVLTMSSGSEKREPRRARRFTKENLNNGAT